MGSSLDYQTTLASVARAAIPILADWCVVYIVEDEEVRQLEVAHQDPTKIELVRRLQERYPVDWLATHGLAQVIRTGQSEVYAEFSEELLEARVPDPDRRALIRQLGLRSVVLVPLVSQGHVFGAIAMAAAESPELQPQ